MTFIDEDKYKDSFGIYRIRNIIDGKVYVGQTGENFQRRYWHHAWTLDNGCHCNEHLQRAWNKYGSDSFVYEVVCVVNNVDELDNLEIYYIKLAKESASRAYNMSDGGDGKRGYSMSEESKKIVGTKNRQHMLGRKASEETKSKMRASSKHVSPTDEHRRSISEYMKNRNVSEETRKKISDAFSGSKSNFAKLSESQVEKIKIDLMNGNKVKDIAESFNVSYNCIKSIKHNETWKSIYVDGWEEFIKD